MLVGQLVVGWGRDDTPLTIAAPKKSEWSLGLGTRVRLGMNLGGYAGTWRGNCHGTIKGSTAFPNFNQLLPLVVVYAPHLEVNANVVVEGDVTGSLFRVPI